MVALSLLAAPVSQLNVAAAASSTSTMNPVYITSKSYIKLESADLVPSSKGNTFSYTITITNKDKSTLNLQDYWTRLTSVSGSKYTINLIDSDKRKKTLAAGASVSLTFYSEVPANMSISNLSIKVIKFDFNYSGYERTLGKFTFPSGYSNDVKVNGYKVAKINDTNVNMRVNKAVLSTGVEEHDIDIEFVLRNTGKYDMTLSNYQFYLQTAAGSLYKLTPDSDHTASIVLRPQILETVDLSIELPSTVKVTGAKLIVTQAIGEGDAAVSLPVAKFKLGFSTTSNVATDTYLYKNGSYSYQMKVASINRYAWSNSDNIISKLTITNTGTTSVPIPAITGAFYVDSSTEITTKALPLTTQLSIPAKGSVTLYYYGTVPSNYVLSDLKFKLFKTEGDKKTELAALKTTTAATAKVVPAGTSYVLDVNGEKTSAAVTSFRVFNGEYNNMYAIYMDVSNINVRAQLTDKWIGYLEASNGSLYETKLTKTSNTINPGQKEQIIVTAEVPKGVSLTGSTLLLGTAFNDAGLIKNEDAAKGYVNAARFQLPVEESVTSKFDNIRVGPYQIDISYLTAYLNGTNFALDVKSEVKRDSNYDAFSSKTLTIAVEDESINLTMFEVTIQLEGKEGEIWKSGGNYSAIKKDLSDKKISSDLTLNIYEELNGYKRKIVSKPIRSDGFANWADPNQLK